MTTQALRDQPEQRLAATLILAALLHVAVLLGVRFSTPTPPFEPVLSFNVELVERAGTTEANRPLGEQHTTVHPPQTPPPAPAARPEPPAPEVSPRPAPSPSEIVSHAHKPAPAAQVQAPPPVAKPLPRPSPPRPQEEAAPPRPTPPVRAPRALSAAELMGSGIDMVQNSAPVPPSSSRGRSKRADPNDASSLEGYYAAAWVAKVERIGALNFPDEARRRNLTGSLTLAVVIAANGSVREITVLRSSGIPALDEGARRIVELGAPYAPFPEALRRRYDTLVITRGWQFLQGAQLRAR